MTLTDDSRILLRPLTVEDHDALVALQLRCFPTMKPWSREQLESQLRRWPEAQLGVFLEGRLVASCAHLILDSAEDHRWSDWSATCDGGMCTNHDEDGDTLYGIEIQVDPSMRGMRLSRRLYDARKQICRERNLRRMVIGGRIPGYAAVREELTATEYVEQVITQRRHDAVLTAQLANGFVVRRIVPDYLPNDEDSAGYATELEWANLDHVSRRSRRGHRAVHPVRVSFVQMQMRRVASWEEFERHCAFFVDTAADYRADVVVFPELFTLQLLSLVSPGRPGHAARQVAGFTDRYIEAFRAMAMRFNVNILGGSTFAAEEDGLYNVAYLFHRDGRVSAQKKIHVTPSEAKWWGIRGGDRVEPIDTDFGRVGVLICYDVEFPELARKLAADGVGLLLVPYNTSDAYGHWRVRACAQARCIENHMFVVTSGCVGNLPMVENADVHYARSAILTPSDFAFARDGLAVEADANIETVIAHDLDLEALRRHRRFGTVRNHHDRRLDLYEVLWKGPDGPRSV